MSDDLARGDAAWSRRAEGHAAGTGRAAAGPIGEAIAAYERALQQQPDRLDAYWKLLRAEAISAASLRGGHPGGDRRFSELPAMSQRRGPRIGSAARWEGALVSTP